VLLEPLEALPILDAEVVAEPVSQLCALDAQEIAFLGRIVFT
jgi:hypothetical protein